MTKYDGWGSMIVSNKEPVLDLFFYIDNWSGDSDEQTMVSLTRKDVIKLSEDIYNWLNASTKRV